MDMHNYKIALGYLLENEVTDEVSFKKAFFNIMHLFKAKATLSDYLNLNRRYIKTTDVFTLSDLLYENCDISKISACLVVSDKTVVARINE